MKLQRTATPVGNCETKLRVTEAEHCTLFSQETFSYVCESVCTSRLGVRRTNWEPVLGSPWSVFGLAIIDFFDNQEITCLSGNDPLRF